MRELIQEIKQFLREDFHLWGYVSVIVFISISTIYNYETNFEKHTINSYSGTNISYAIQFAYFIFPYYAATFISLAFKKKLYKLKQTEFWVKSLAFFGIFAASYAFRDYQDWLKTFEQFTRNERVYLTRIITEGKRIIPYLIVFWIVKKVYDKDLPHLYGLRFGGIDFRPFLWMLLIMLPLIAASSFLPSFRKSYPQFKYWHYQDVFGLAVWLRVMIVEFIYGFDFITVELLFRGALVIGMVKVLGKEAVLPMVAAYVFIHFGKPPGEAISSFFGGFILGIHSYYKKNIFAGILIHIGIAWMMEAAAIIQHQFN